VIFDKKDKNTNNAQNGKQKLREKHTQSQ